ncbi:MAG: hypothetical protein HKN24_07140 [Acidimicrobiales bacterium]|nr:hypothetical protein [Acidimicrobiales bacterium]
MLGDFDMVGVPHEGRTFSICDRVRLGDVSRDGHLRLDALVRYSQIISNDDTNDVGLEDDLAWIARSTVIDVEEPAMVNEPLEMTTFCGGLGRTWAERRVVVIGGWKARYELATLWISIDTDSGRPRRLTDQFLDVYGPATGGRKVSARQRISRPSPELIESGERLDWTPRWTDVDPFMHMNNVVYWSALHHALGSDPAPSTRLLVEHGAGVEPDHHTEAVVERRQDGLRMWWLTDGASGELSDQYLAAAEVIAR